MKKTEKENRNARRVLLKSTALAGVATQVLPTAWVKPVIDTVLLPAHAQTSMAMVDPSSSTDASSDEQQGVACLGGVQVALSWNGSADSESDSSDDNINNDLDLEMLTQGGTRIAPKALNGVLAGSLGLVHGGDVVGSGIETISSPADSTLEPGRYRLFVRYNGNLNISYRLRLSACGQQASPFTGNVSSDFGVRTVGSINLSEGGTTTVRLGTIKL